MVYITKPPPAVIRLAYNLDNPCKGIVFTEMGKSIVKKYRKDFH